MNPLTMDVVAEGRRGTSDSDEFTADDLVWFEEPRHPGESLTRSRRFVVDRQSWIDIGSPSQIEVNVMPPRSSQFRSQGTHQ